MAFRKKMFSGVIWSAIDRLSMQAVQFGLGIVLANLLSPTEYGVIGILLVFITLSQVFIDSGFPMAVVQKVDRKDIDISTAFVFNIVIAICAYGLLFFGAPFVADFYEMPELSLYLRVLAITLVINSLHIIPATLFTIDLNFKSVAKVNFSATLLSGAFAIYLAYEGYGVWAFIWQAISRAVLTLIFTWILTKWKMSFRFSWESFRSMFSYGSNLLVSSLLNRFVNDATNLVIGKLYTKDQLGLYTRGTQFADFFSGSYSSILNRVLLPGLVDLQNDIEKLKNKFQVTIRLTNLLCFPAFFGLFVLAEPMIVVLLKEEWYDAIPIMRVFCIARFLSIWCALNLNILKIIGRTDLLLRQQYWVIGTRIVILVAFVQHGIFYIALAEMISTSIHLFINAYYPGKLINYRLWEQMKDSMAYCFFALIMAAAVYGLTFVIENHLYQLIAGVLIGAFIYMGFMIAFRKKDLIYIKQLIS